MNIKAVISLFLFMGFINILVAQDTIKNSGKFSADRLFTGGNLGLQIGDNTFIDISPLLGYHLTSRADIGFGVSYQYMSYKYVGIKTSTNVYGGRVFGRYYITENIFAHAEYELLNLEPIYFNGYYYKTDRRNFESYLLGGGYRQFISGNLSLSLLILWNFNDDPLFRLYDNPIFRFGINMGI